MMVATGKIIEPMIRSTRTEIDYLEHIHDVVATNPTANWIIVVDNLNTHISESLVRFVDFQCGLAGDLGVKGRSGILKSKKTRQNFLENPLHRIRFQYCPKHTSWLNQIEVWFSILTKKLLRREFYSTKEALKTGLLNFIKYFNETMAKPFNWTYTGKPLSV